MKLSNARISCLLLLGFLLGTSAFSQVAIQSEDKSGLEVIARYMNQHGEWTDDFLTRANYEIPNYIIPDVWRQFPAIRKLETAYMAAENGVPGGGKSLLALLSRNLAQLYESIYHEPAISAYRDVPTIQIIFDNRFIPTEAVRLPTSAKKCIYSLSSYLEASALGSVGDVMTNYFGLTSDQAYEILRTSNSITASLETALGKASIPPPMRQRLASIINDLSLIFESIPHDKNLSKYIREKQGLLVEESFINKAETAPLNGGLTNFSNEKRYQNYIKKNYEPEPTATPANRAGSATPSRERLKKFDNMLKSRKGFGGIILGNKLAFPHNLQIQRVAWVPQHDTIPISSSIKLGYLKYTMLDRATNRTVTALSPGVLEEDIYLANQIIHKNKASMQNGEGIGLTGVEFDKELANEYGEVMRGKVILHPSIVNTSLGWALLHCDLFPDTEELLSDLTRWNPESAKKFKSLYSTFSLFGWRFSDSPLKVTYKNNMVSVSPDWATNTTSTNSLFNFRYFKGDSVVSLNEFNLLLGDILHASPEYRRLNNFIRIFSLVRWINQSQIAIENLPAKINLNPTPYCVYEQTIGDLFSFNPKRILFLPRTIREEYVSIRNIYPQKSLTGTIGSTTDSLLILFQESSTKVTASIQAKDRVWEWLYQASTADQADQQKECGVNSKSYLGELNKYSGSDYSIYKQIDSVIHKNLSKLKELDREHRRAILSKYYIIKNNELENSILRSLINDFCEN